MGNLRALLTVAVIAFAAACGDDGGSNKPVDAAIVIVDAAIDAPPDAYVPDAPNYDFTCLNNAAPTTAANTVTLAGTAQEITLDFAANPPIAISPSANVAIQACRDNCMGQDNLGTVMSAATTGAFTTAALTTGGTPLDGYLVATKTGFQNTRVYPAAPVTANLADVPVLLMSSQVYANLGLAGITHGADNAIVATFVTDCAGTPIGGANVTVTRGGVSLGNTMSAGALDPSAEGGFITFDVPPDTTAANTVVNATYMGMTLRSHTVRTVANTLTATAIEPGF
ncbi:MAG: hypothetical protein JWP01_2131 [Myxococcales bacterium]|nr:hypothetical protein [Myxococcales bacterium]